MPVITTHKHQMLREEFPRGATFAVELDEPLDIDALKRSLAKVDFPQGFHSQASQRDFVTGHPGVGKTTLSRALADGLDLDWIGSWRCCVDIKSTVLHEKLCLKWEWILPIEAILAREETCLLGNGANIWSDQLELNWDQNGGLHTELHPALCRYPWRTIIVLSVAQDAMRARLLSPSRVNDYGKRPGELQLVQEYAASIATLITEPRPTDTGGIPVTTAISAIDTTYLTPKQVLYHMLTFQTRRAPSVYVEFKNETLGFTAMDVLRAVEQIKYSAPLLVKEHP